VAAEHHGRTATGLDDQGIPEFSPELPRIPVPGRAVLGNVDAPGNPGLRQEVWTEQALHEGMQRIGHGVSKLPSLDGWLIAELPDGGGLQLQQSDGTLFVYALCEVDPA
jgi:hypothetical protein